MLSIPYSISGKSISWNFAPTHPIFTPILFQLLSEYVLKQKFKPKYV